MDGRLVVVQALKAYDNHSVGDIFPLPMSQATAHLIVSHYLRLLEDPAWKTADGDGETEPSPDPSNQH